MSKQTRFKWAVSLAALLVFCNSGILAAEGYARWVIFPVFFVTTDLPHCPRCDHLGVRLPPVEILLATGILYGLISAPGWLRRKANLGA